MLAEGEKLDILRVRLEGGKELCMGACGPEQFQCASRALDLCRFGGTTSSRGEGDPSN